VRAGDNVPETHKEPQAAMTRRTLFPPAVLPALCALCALALLLSGCWVPEHYMSRIKIERDGSYKVSIEGTAVHPEAWRAMKRVEAEARAGKLKPEELKKAQVEALAPLLKDLEALKADKRVEYANSIGDGRVRFSFSGGWAINRNLMVSSELTSPIEYGVGADGTLRLRVKDAVEGPEARALGVKTEGSLAVALAEGIEVLEHNAQKVPTSPLGAYRWSIGPGPGKPPYLKIRLPEAAAAKAEPAAQKGLAHH
jgi:hypothetical protein